MTPGVGKSLLIDLEDIKAPCLRSMTVLDVLIEAIAALAQNTPCAEEARRVADIGHRVYVDDKEILNRVVDSVMRDIEQARVS